MRKPIILFLASLLIAALASTGMASAQGVLSELRSLPTPEEEQLLLDQYVTLTYLDHQRTSGGAGPVVSSAGPEYPSFTAFQSEFPGDLPLLAERAGKTPAEFLATLINRAIGNPCA